MALPEPTPERLVDLTSFYVAFSAYTFAQGLEDPHAAKGLVIARNLKRGMTESLDSMIYPLIESGQIGRIKAKAHAARKGGSAASVAQAQADLMTTALSRIKNKGKLFNETFKGKSRSGARDILMASKQENAVSVVHNLATIPSMSGLQNPRRWVIEAAKILGAPVSDFEQTVADAESAVNLAERRRELDVQIENGDPMDPSIVDLMTERQAVTERVQDVVDNSPNPDAVLSAAVGELAKPVDSKTAVGRRLNLSDEQEAALIAEGKTIIAAGAGSGKTRVMAGMVALAVLERGYSASQVLATSFTRKSSKELFDRCQKYSGGVLPDRNDALIGRTTHSIAASIVREWGTEEMKNGLFKAADDGIRDILIQIAVRQAKMGEEATVTDRLLLYVLQAREAILKEVRDGGFSKMGWMVKDRKTGLTVDKRGKMQGLLGSVIENFLKKDRIPTEKMMKWIHKVIDKYGEGLGTGYSPDEIESFKNLKQASTRQASTRLAARKKKPKGKNEWFEEKRRKEMASLRDSVRNSNYNVLPAGEWFNIGAGEGLMLSEREASTFISKYKGASPNPAALYSASVENQEPKKAHGAAIWGAYEWLKGNDPGLLQATKGAPAMDMEDALWAVGDIMQADPDARASMQGRMRVVLVDEAQDLAPSQHRMFEYLAGARNPETDEVWQEGEPGRPPGGMTADTYSLIGDDKQAIYRFRGAEIEEFTGRSDSKGGDFDTKQLTMNYRSRSAIVEAANNLIAVNEGQIKMECRADYEKGAGTVDHLHKSKYGDLADHVVDEILYQTEHDDLDGSFKDFGIAVRNNAEADAFEMKFVSAGILYRRKGSFFSKPTVQAIMNWTKLGMATSIEARNHYLIKTTDEPTSFLGYMFGRDLERKVPRGVDWASWLQDNELFPPKWTARNEAAKNHAKNADLVRAAVEGGATGAELMGYIIQLEGPKGDTILKKSKERAAGQEGGLEVIESVQAPVEQLEVSDKADEAQGGTSSEIEVLLGMFDSHASLGDAVEFYDELVEMQKRAQKGDDEEINAVELLTCHGWKGLERKNMFVVMNAGTFPPARRLHKDPVSGMMMPEHPLSQTADEYERQLEEERRLAYVGITRGGETVTVMSSDENHLGMPSGPSQFVEEAGCIRAAPSLEREASLVEKWGPFLIPEGALGS
jgi:superfamily I DNA/RNA helicase